MHTAIIMDGNGRWAAQRGMARTEGHRRGVDAIRRTVEAAPRLGIEDLTLFAFSAGNWKRPAEEVGALLGLLSTFLQAEAERCRENGVRVTAIGRRDRIGAALRRGIERAESATAGGTALHLRLAIDYSGRESVMGAARFCAEWAGWSEDAFSRALPAPPVDLLIRTGGEQRLSDFLLWECAWAEIVFLPCMWPEFGPEHLAEAVAAFRSRERRFGALPAA